MERQLLNMTPRIAALKLDERGYPVPKFVEYINGKPDFRVIKADRINTCVRNNLCWICDQPLGVFKTFTIGPMCCVNRVISEPPSHKDCAVFAVTNCPFLTKPLAKRNERNLPEETEGMPGIPIARNPGIACLWTVREYSRFKVHNGTLFKLGNPIDISFWREGREATMQEILDSVESGLPILEEMAKEDGPEACLALKVQVDMFHRLLELHGVAA